jgi:hypothetical protein
MSEGPIPGSIWVEPGRLLAGPYPAHQLERLTGIDVFLDLTHERDRLEPYGRSLAPGVRAVRRSVRDFTVPKPGRMSETLDLLELELAGGNVVYVHCRGGIGRTGTLLGCLLVRRGMSGDEALAWLQRTGKEPETAAQRELVREWRKLDRRGRLTRGSRIQVAVYVNRRPGELAQAVLNALPDLAARRPRLCWTAPLLQEGLAEPRDRDFLRAVGRDDLAAELAAFWPERGGPVWDALGLVVFPDRAPGVMLVEGKSYPGEFAGPGSGAQPASRKRIARALAETQRWLGIPEAPKAWLESAYQQANRYAHLYWLRERVRVEAWFVHVLFVDDRTYRSTTQATWNVELPGVHDRAGLAGVAVPFAGTVFLPALAAVELTRKPASA